MARSNGQKKINVFNAGINTFTGGFAFHKICQPSVVKLRRFGFRGFVDTMESIFEMYQDSVKMGIISSPVVAAARPMIQMMGFLPNGCSKKRFLPCQL